MNIFSKYGFITVAILMGTCTALSASAQTSVSAGLNISGSCQSCDLSSRDMSRLSLNGEDFSQSNFSRSNLSGGQFNQSNLTGAQFSRANLVRARGEGVNLHSAVLNDTTLTEATLNRSNLSKTDLSRAVLTRGSFKGSDFSQSQFISGDATGANFTDANFGLAKLHHTNFENAIFIGAKLKHTEFGAANVTGADFTAADLSGADLRDVLGLTQAQLNQGCGNPSTQISLGSGLTIPYCPAYSQMAASKSSLPTTRSIRAIMVNGKNVWPQFHQLAITQSGLRESIHTIERAIAALPARGSQASRAELEMSLAQLRALHDALSYPR